MEEVTLIINGIEVKANVTKQFIKDYGGNYNE